MKVHNLQKITKPRNIGSNEKRIPPNTSSISKDNKKAKQLV